MNSAVPLSELLTDVQAGYACGERDPNGLIQLRMNNVTTDGCWDWSSYIRVPIDEPRQTLYSIAIGDVLFNNTNSTEQVGKSALFTGSDEPIVFSNHFTRLRTNSLRLDPEYLSYWLLSLWKKGVFARLCDKWIGQSAIQRKKLLALQIPLLELKEQKHVAARLREQLAEAVSARKAVEEQLRAAEALYAAFLREEFASSKYRSWPDSKIGDTCEVQLGKMLSPKSKQGIRPIPYLRNANVQWGRFDLQDIAEMDFDQREQAKFALRKGDLLVCEGGEPGRAAIWDGEIEPCCYQKALHRLRPIDGQVDPQFLMYRLWYAASIGEFADNNAKTTIAHLPAVRLMNLKIALPPIQEQRRIASDIMRGFRQADAVKQAFQQKLVDIEKLSPALLREAFTGAT